VVKLLPLVVSHVLKQVLIIPNLPQRLLEFTQVKGDILGLPKDES
jgi:hypothetical protein